VSWLATFARGPHCASVPRGNRTATAGDPTLAAWAEGQRRLARALGLSIEEWLEQLDAAAERRTGVTAAIVGAAVSSGQGLGVLDGLEPSALAARARGLVDPRPPRVDHPVLAEAVRRAAELAPGLGRARLQGARGVTPPPVPQGAPDAPPVATSDEDLP
jgi:hypothetical protein